MEASTALPPFFKILIASSVASGCDVAAIPLVDIASLSFVD